MGKLPGCVQMVKKLQWQTGLNWLAWLLSSKWTRAFLTGVSAGDVVTETTSRYSSLATFATHPPLRHASDGRPDGARKAPRVRPRRGVLLGANIGAVQVGVAKVANLE